MLKYGGLSQVGLMAALLKSVGRLKRRGGSSPSSSAINIGIQGESSCYMSVIKGKSCIFREYNRINGKTCCVDIACTPLE